MPALVELHSVSKQFGSLRAVDDVSLHLESGEAVGIVGPNGAGKTTLLDVMAGSLRADRGRILFDGRDVTRLPGHQRSRAGMGRTFQIPRPFGGLTAYENVLVGATHSQGRREREARDECLAALDRVGLAAKANALARSLTLLERKRLELARALATGPKVLLLDEIAGGLTEPEIQALVESIEDVRAQGVSIVWIEHIVHALLSVVDRLVALDSGRKLIEGEPAAVIASTELREVYLGDEL